MESGVSKTEQDSRDQKEVNEKVDTLLQNGTVNVTGQLETN